MHPVLRDVKNFKRGNFKSKQLLALCVVRRCFAKKLIFKQRPKEMEGWRCVAIEGRAFKQKTSRGKGLLNAHI